MGQFFSLLHLNIDRTSTTKLWSCISAPGAEIYSSVPLMQLGTPPLCCELLWTRVSSMGASTADVCSTRSGWRLERISQLLSQMRFCLVIQFVELGVVS
jgi:hypothetical protein